VFGSFEPHLEAWSPSARILPIMKAKWRLLGLVMPGGPHHRASPRPDSTTHPT
jgi:hypothetical protein